MKLRLYALKNYTEQGDLKPPQLFTFILLFLARTWAVLVVSVISRESGTQILHIFYPDKAHFYLGLILGTLPLIVFFISGRRHAQNRYAIKVWPACLYAIYLAVFVDLLMQIYYLSIVHFQYSLTASIQLVIVLWCGLYIFKSKQLKDSFKN